MDGVRLIPHAWGKVHPTMDGVGLMRVHSSGDMDTGGYRVRGSHFFWCIVIGRLHILMHSGLINDMMKGGVNAGGGLVREELCVYMITIHSTYV